jgi:hypothetical protein
MCPEFGGGEVDVMLGYVLLGVRGQRPSSRIAVVIIGHRRVAVPGRDTSARVNMSKSWGLMIPVGIFKDT